MLKKLWYYAQLELADIFELVSFWCCSADALCAIS